MFLIVVVVVVFLTPHCWKKPWHRCCLATSIFTLLNERKPVKLAARLFCMGQSRLRHVLRGVKYGGEKNLAFSTSWRSFNLEQRLASEWEVWVKEGAGYQRLPTVGWTQYFGAGAKEVPESLYGQHKLSSQLCIKADVREERGRAAGQFPPSLSGWLEGGRVLGPYERGPRCGGQEWEETGYEAELTGVWGRTCRSIK